MEYDLIISLGPACETSYHIRRHRLQYAAYPFDWVITEFRPLYNCFVHDFEGFLTSREDLVITNKTEPTNKYGVVFRHELQDEGGYPDFEDAKAKYERRAKRLLDVMYSTKRVLFIRRGGMAKDQAIELNKLWQDKYTVDYHVAIIQKTPTPDWKLHRFSNLYLPETDQQKKLAPRERGWWQGDHEAWDGIFNQLV